MFSIEYLSNSLRVFDLREMQTIAWEFYHSIKILNVNYEYFYFYSYILNVE